MRKIYIAVIAFLILSILLFIASFIYLDKEKHKIYTYTINIDGRYIGTIRIDKFETEDKLIYKSVSTTPFYNIFTETKERITLNRKYSLEDYIKERSGKGASETTLLENKINLASFATNQGAEFACLDNIPIKKDTFIFDEDSPLTYLPIIENYNFRKGKYQGFNTLTCFSDSLLPPMKRFITLTSIRDEYLKIDSRKIKTENLWLKIRNYPQGSIWVAKSDRSLVRLELPKKALVITRVFSPKAIYAKEYILTNEEYIQKEVSFKNKNVQLAGTLTVPRKEGKYPAVLLVWGEGAQDRWYYGLFTSIADYLAKNGFCVLMFDKRGIGSSGGDMSSGLEADDIEDVKAALEYLGGQKDLDVRKMAVLGHGRGAYYAIRASRDNDNIKAIVAMAPLLPPSEPKDGEDLGDFKTMAANAIWTDEYKRLVARSVKETWERVRASQNNWIYIVGKRIFLGRMKERLEGKPAIDTVKDLKIPVFILQGKAGLDTSADNASMLDKALADSKNPSHALVYYSYLDSFFGKRVNDGVVKIHYEADKDVLENIKAWLNTNMNEATPPSEIKPPEVVNEAVSSGSK